MERRSNNPVIKKNTRETSTLCSRCGKRFQESSMKWFLHNREFWCDTCQRWIAITSRSIMNQSLRGLPRPGSSKGDAGKAMMGNVDNVLPLIFRVDASSCSRCNYFPDSTTEPNIILNNDALGEDD